MRLAGSGRFSIAPSRWDRPCWSPARSASITDASSPREFIILADAGLGRRRTARRAGCFRSIPPPRAEPQDHPRAGQPASRRAGRRSHQTFCPSELRGADLACRCPRRSRAVHRPDSLAEAERGRRRLAFDELLDLQLMLARARLIAKRAPQRSGLRDPARPHPRPGAVAALEAHRRSEARHPRDHRRHDLAGTDAPDPHGRCRHREDGRGARSPCCSRWRTAIQAALMAPTELLAEQHAATLTDLLAPLRIRPELLLGRLSTAEKADRRSRLSNGSLRLVVGTHALVQESVSFQRLGLVVIDEQHRFGVEQRAALVGKGRGTRCTAAHRDADPAFARPHPLRRSRPVRHQDPSAGPGQVKTGIRTAKQRDQAFAFVREQCRAGRQAYVVLPVIEESERADLRAATTMAELLKEKWPDLDGGAGARPAQARRAGRRDAAVPRGRDPGPGGDDGHRGRYRRAERHRDAHRAPGAIRPRPTAPAAGSSRSRVGRELLHPPHRRPPAPRRSRPSPRPTMGSRSPSWIWRSGRWET